MEYDRHVDGIHDLDHFHDGAFVEAMGPVDDGETGRDQCSANTWRGWISLETCDLCPPFSPWSAG